MTSGGAVGLPEHLHPVLLLRANDLVLGAHTAQHFKRELVSRRTGSNTRLVGLWSGFTASFRAAHNTAPVEYVDRAALAYAPG